MFDKHVVVTGYVLFLGTLNFIGFVYLGMVISQLKSQNCYWKKKLQSFLGINYNRKGKIK